MRPCFILAPLPGSFEIFNEMFKSYCLNSPRGTRLQPQKSFQDKDTFSFVQGSLCSKETVFFQGSTTNGTSPVPLLMHLSKTLAFAVHCTLDQCIITCTAWCISSAPRKLTAESLPWCILLLPILILFNFPEHCIGKTSACIVVTAKDGL